MADFAALDNPIWTALTARHQFMARGDGLARRYPSDVSPLSGMADASPAAFADLAGLVEPKETVALFNTKPIEVPGDWQVVRTRWIEQMVCTEKPEPPSIMPAALGEADIPEMLELTEATKPGPFLTQTVRMGRYFGIRSADGRLAAMAGERLKPNGLTETSAVCTHPDFRGRGYGRALVAYVAGLIFAENKIPFLHVNTENPAISVYKAVGFRVRRSIWLTVLSRG